MPDFLDPSSFVYKGKLTVGGENLGAGSGDGGEFSMTMSEDGTRVEAFNHLWRYGGPAKAPFHAADSYQECLVTADPLTGWSSATEPGNANEQAEWVLPALDVYSPEGTDTPRKMYSPVLGAWIAYNQNKPGGRTADGVGELTYIGQVSDIYASIAYARKGALQRFSYVGIIVPNDHAVWTAKYNQGAPVEGVQSEGGGVSEANAVWVNGMAVGFFEARTSYGGPEITVWGRWTSPDGLNNVVIDADPVRDGALQPANTWGNQNTRSTEFEVTVDPDGETLRAVGHAARFDGVETVDPGLVEWVSTDYGVTWTAAPQPIALIEDIGLIIGGEPPVANAKFGSPSLVFLPDGRKWLTFRYKPTGGGSSSGVFLLEAAA